MLLDFLGGRRIRPILFYSLAPLVLGTLIVRWLEGWSSVDAFYFCAIMLFTFGNGDLTPTTDLTKGHSVLYTFNGVGLLVAFASPAIQVRAEQRR